LLVFIHTSPFRPGPKYSRSITIPLRRPTADTNLLVAAAVAGLKAIYKPGYNYSKAGVMLLDLQADTVHQGELALDADEAVDRSALMGALDKLNDRFGRGTLKVASEGLAGDKRAWSMRQQMRTPHYTTSWNDVSTARA